MRVQPHLPSRPLVATVMSSAGIGLMRMQRREQPGAAGAEDQDVGLEPFEHECLLDRTDQERDALTTAASDERHAVASCFCPSRQGRFSMTSTRMPPSMCTASRNTSTVSASLTTGLAVHFRKPSSRASPSMARPERQEVQRQEAGERQPRDAVHHGRDPQRVAAMAARVLSRRARRHDSTTAATALRPSAARISPKPHIRTSSPRPLSPVHSDATTRTPMAPCVAAASTNSA